MARLLAFLLLAAALAPSARAVDLELGWTSEVAWDSNPLGQQEDEEPDFSLYGGPNLRLLERSRSLDLIVGYNLRYEQFIDFRSVNGFEHFGHGSVAWRPSLRTELTVRNDFSRTRGLNALFLTPVPGIDPIDEGTEFRIDRSLRTRNVSSLAATHRLSPRWSLESTLDGDLYDSDAQGQAASLAIRGAAQLVRALTPRLVAGAGLALTRNSFDDTEWTVGSGSTIGEAFGLARYDFSPTLSLSVAGGPAWSFPDDAPDTAFVPVNGVRQDSGGVTRLVDPGRCVLPTAEAPPAGTVSLASCPRADSFFIAPDGSLQFAPSALIGSAAIDPRTFHANEVDVLGEIQDPDDSMTFFGRVAIEKRWRTVTASAFYQRRSSTSSGLNATTDLDLATAFVTWRPDRQRWRFDVRGTWARQTAANEQSFSDVLLDPNPVTVYVTPSGRISSVPVPGATMITNAARVIGVRRLGSLDTDYESKSYRIDLSASRRFTENLIVRATAGWWRQETQDSFRDEPSEVDNLRFVLGFTWSLEPIEL